MTTLMLKGKLEDLKIGQEILGGLTKKGGIVEEITPVSDESICVKIRFGPKLEWAVCARGSFVRSIEEAFYVTYKVKNDKGNLIFEQERRNHYET